jgi:chloramphenicol-sensitive protein RarD
VKKGLWLGAVAYALWGMFPLYFSLIRHVPTGQVMGHRILWSCLALGALVIGARQRPALTSLSRSVVALYALAAVLVGVNWSIYVWAISAGFVVESSLGYFITPLVNVLLGVVVLRERLRVLQWIAVGLATAGVVYLTVTYGAPPWIAMGLAISFGSYGLVKKRAPLTAVDGLMLETVILVAPALLYLMFADRTGTGVFLHTGTKTDLLLAGTGPVTIVPLLLFATAVRRVPLSVVGILQYIAPTLQFTIGVFLFHEAFSQTQLTGFALVWTALLLFALDGLRQSRE